MLHVIYSFYFFYWHWFRYRFYCTNTSPRNFEIVTAITPSLLRYQSFDDFVGVRGPVERKNERFPWRTNIVNNTTVCHGTTE